VANYRFATFFRRLSEAAEPRGGEYGPCPDFTSYSLAFALKLKKITVVRIQGSLKAFGLSAPRAIRLVDWPSGHASLGFRFKRRY